MRDCAPFMIRILRFNAMKHSITSFSCNGLLTYRAHVFSKKGYSTCTFAEISSAELWIKIVEGR